MNNPTTPEKKLVKVITVAMTKEIARRVFKNRPVSKYAETRYGGNIHVDDFCLLMMGKAKRCIMCIAPTRNEYLANGICPDCDGRSEAAGDDPYYNIYK